MSCAPQLSTARPGRRRFGCLGSPGRFARGFTLIELLLVLAVLVAVAGLSWPALRGPLAKHRLRAAATGLATELGRARLRAIQSGRTVEFECLPGTGEFRISQAAASQSLGDSQQPNTAGDDGLPRLEAQTLSEGITFAPLDFVPPEQEPTSGVPGSATPRPNTLPSPARQALPAAGEPAAGGDQEWSAPLALLPDGTTSDAQFWLLDARGWRCPVELRGLTGAARVGEVVRPEVMP